MRHARNHVTKSVNIHIISKSSSSRTWNSLFNWFDGFIPYLFRITADILNKGDQAGSMHKKYIHFSRMINQGLMNRKG